MFILNVSVARDVNLRRARLSNSAEIKTNDIRKTELTHTSKSRKKLDERNLNKTMILKPYMFFLHILHIIFSFIQFSCYIIAFIHSAAIIIIPSSVSR